MLIDKLLGRRRKKTFTAIPGMSSNLQVHEYFEHVEATLFMKSARAVCVFIC